MAANACPVGITSDERFQTLKNNYPDYEDGWLKDSLQLFREINDKGTDFFPSTPEDYADFSSFIHERLIKTGQETSATNMTEDDVVKLYSALYSTFSPKILKARVDSIFNDFVDIVYKRMRKRKLDNPAEAVESLGGYKAILDKIRAQYDESYDSLFEKIKQTGRYDDTQAAERAQYIVDEYKKIKENWGRLTALASEQIGSTLGLQVTFDGLELVHDNKNVDLEIVKVTEEDNREDNDNDKVNAEGRSMKGDQYIDYRTKKLADTLSTRLRTILQNIIARDSAGNIITDDLGNATRIGYRQATYALVEVLEYTDPEDFMSDLEDAQTQYPWLSTLVEILDRNKDWQTDFFVGLKKASHYYESIIRQGDEYSFSRDNTRATSFNLMVDAGNKMSDGIVLDEEYSVYDKNGISRQVERLKSAKKEVDAMLDTVERVHLKAGVEAKVETVNAQRAEHPYIDGYGPEMMNLWFNHLNNLPADSELRSLGITNTDEYFSMLARMARGIGLQISSAALKAMAMNEISQTTRKILDRTAGNSNYQNRLDLFVKTLSKIYEKASTTRYRNNVSAFYNYIEQELRVLNMLLAPSVINELEHRALVNGKTYSTWATGGFMKQWFGKLMNFGRKPNSKWKEFLKKYYVDCEGFTVNGELVGWARALWQRANEFERQEAAPVKIVDLMEFNGVSYADVTRAQKATATFLTYYLHRKANDTHSFYEFVIQADYENAWNFMEAPVYSTGISIDEYVEENNPDMSTEDKDMLKDRYREMFGSETMPLYYTERGDNGETREVYVLDEEGNGSRTRIVDMLSEEVEAEYMRILAIRQRANTPHVVLKEYEDAGVKFNVFPEFNTNGFEQEYARLQNEGKAAEAKEFLRHEVAKQLEKRTERDADVLYNEGVLENPIFPSELINDSETGNNTFSSVGKTAVREFSMNTYYARLEMVKLFLGDFSQFGSLANFEKRCMLLHAPRLPMYTYAYFDGKEAYCQDETVLYVDDDRTRSAVYDEMCQFAKKAYDAGLISKLTYDQMISSYKSIKSTDGQGLRTLESHRLIRIAANRWSKKHEEAYNRIMNGNVQQGDIDTVLSDDTYMEPQKLFASGVEIIPAAEGDLQKNIRATFTHKYSEAVLLPFDKMPTNFDAQSPQVKAFGILNKRLEQDGRKVDLFLFSSNVKTALHSSVNPYEVKNGERVYKTAGEMAKMMYEHIKAVPTAIHTIPLEFLGTAASTPAHLADSRITVSSQAEKKAFANVDLAPDEEVLIGDKKVMVGDNPLTLVGARDLHEKILAACYIEAAEELEKIKQDPVKLAELLKEELISKPYVSDELAYALSLVRDASGSAKFVMPLFSPSVEHAVQQLFNSFIENRVVRLMTKGANVMQVTSLGSDKESFPFTYDAPEEDKLSVEVEKDKDGNVERIKWIDCYIAIHDTRLERFADPDGTIPPKKLRKLVEDGIIAEEALRFIAYRTPSDAEHSILPLRIKGFLARSGGPKIVVSKEAMSMTGHDYDGDKLRCHFQDFTIAKETYNEELLESDYRDALSKLSQDEVLGGKYTFERFRKARLDKKDAMRDRYIVKPERVEMKAYDYNESPVNQSVAARNNARVQLMFAVLTSKSGSLRLPISGGAGETVYHAKRIRAMKSLMDPSMRIGLKLVELDKMKTQKSPNRKLFFESRAVTPENAYEFLKTLSNDELDALFASVDKQISPYSFEHSVDAHEYMMGGARMIGVYAMLSSAADLFQRMHLTFNPYVYKNIKDKNGNPVVLYPKLFGKKYDENTQLFAPRSYKAKERTLISLILARLVNASVDNGKEPVLGYLNQSPELSELTFALVGMGLTEEQIHLFMNQPIMIELNKRMSERGHGTIGDEALNIAKELYEYSAKGAKSKSFNPYSGINNFNRYFQKESTFASFLPLSYEDLKTSKVGQSAKMQMCLASMVWHLSHVSSLLSDFAHATRPEAASNGVGPNNTDTLIQLNRWDKIVGLLNADPALTWIPVHGMEQVFVTERHFVPGMDKQAALDEVYKNAGDNHLARVVALHYLLQMRTADFMANYFPQMRPMWRKRMLALANEYNYRDVQPGVLDKIGQEMILFALEDDPVFGKNFSERQHDSVIEFPKRFEALKERINAMEKAINEGEAIADPEAAALVDNIFIKKLTIDRPYSDADDEKKIVNPRIRFNAGTPNIGMLVPDIRNAWSQLITSEYEGTRKLAKELFEYNLFTSGFGYGMYEFLHFAPMNVIMSIDGYLPALRSVMQYDKFNDNDFWARFRDQYYCNHWGETRLVPRYQSRALSKDLYKLLGIEGNGWSREEDAITLKDLTESGDDFFTVSLSNHEILFFKLVDGVPVAYPKLGIRTKRGQMSVQFDPKKNAAEMKPHQVGLDSSWGDADALASNRPGWMKFKNKKNNFVSGQKRVNAALSDEERRISMRRAGFDDTVIEILMNNASDAVVANEEVLARLRASNVGSMLYNARFNEIITGEEYARAIKQIYDMDIFAQEDNGENEDGQEKMELPEGFDWSELGLSNPPGFLQLVRRTDDGAKIEKVRPTPANIREARKQKVFVELNKRLRPLLAKVNVSIGQLNDAEAQLGAAGITDFETASVVAGGMIEMIRLGNGYEGEMALPEEMAHVSLALLGRDNPLVARLLNTLHNSPEAMREAYEGWYDDYARVYKNDAGKLAFEAAGKLVAKHLFRQQKLETPGIRGLIYRIADAIKEFFRKLNPFEIKNAILEANEVSSELAKQLLGGKLLDGLDARTLVMDGKFYSKFKKDITNQKGIISSMLKNAMRRLAIYNSRNAYQLNGDSDALAARMEKEIGELQQAILEDKTELAVLSFIDNAVSFLAEVEGTLNSAIEENGLSANKICEKVNAMRDTIIGYSQIFEEIEDAMNDGELALTASMRDLIQSTRGKVTSLYEKCDRIGMKYFETAVANFLGDDGITIDIGRERGRHITVKEITRKADHDISLFSRWMHSLANCNDYVLKTIDDLIKHQKWNSRRDTAEIKQKVDVAFADLIRETGSNDQTFMFEYMRGADGRMHKTGRFIQGDAVERLSAPQKKFYNAMMDIKRSMDKLLPEGLPREYSIIMLRKALLDKVKDSNDVKSGLKHVGEAAQRQILDMSEDVDFENIEVELDFEGNRIDRLPVMYLNKAKSESYDDMTDDVASAILAYANMANDYYYLNEVAGIIENMRYMSSKRDIGQRRGFQRLRETITHPADDSGFYRQFTKKQKYTNIQRVMDDLISANLYGVMQEEEGTIGRSRVSKTKLAGFINMMATYSQMALNLPQRISNVTVGQSQIIIESAGKGEYNVKDVAKAASIYAALGADRLMDFGKDDSDNKLSKFIEYFDIDQENGRSFKDAKYAKSRVSKTFNSRLLFAGLTIGEDYLAATTAMAVAFNYKMKDDKGNPCNLWEAYEVKYADPANKVGAHLALKDGYTKADGTPMTKEDERNFAKKCAGLSFDLQGIYNLDDRSAIQRHAGGMLLIMYRKWIAPALKRRYADVQYDPLRQQYTQGYWRTMFEFFQNVIREGNGLRSAISLNWDKMNDYERSNVWRAVTELGIIAGTWLGIFLLHDLVPKWDDDEERSWFEQTMLYNLLKLRNELGAQAPTPLLVQEASKILKSPIAATRPLAATLDVIQFANPVNYVTEIRSGKYKGRKKIYKYWRDLPFISMFKSVDNFVDPSSLISYYENGNF